MNQKTTESIVFDPEWRRLCRQLDRRFWKHHQARTSTPDGYKAFTFASPALAFAAEVQGLNTVFYH